MRHPVHGCCCTRFTLVARFTFCSRTHTVDGLGEDAGASSLSHTARTAEQVGMCQFAGSDGIFQRSSQGTLSHYRLKGRRAIFSCRYDIIFHDLGYSCPLQFVQMYIKKRNFSVIPLIFVGEESPPGFFLIINSLIINLFING